MKTSRRIERRYDGRSSSEASLYKCGMYELSMSSTPRRPSIIVIIIIPAERNCMRMSYVIAKVHITQ